MDSALAMAIAEESWAGPRERAAAIGVESLGDAELIAILLGTGYAGVPVGVLAAMLIEEHGGLSGLARAGLGELTDRAGVGMAKGARLAAAVELGRRVTFAASLEASTKLPDREAVETWARPRLATMDHEELWVLALDGRHGLRAARRVASGGIHGLHVAPRDALRVAIREAASAIVLVHNHPSGVMPTVRLCGAGLDSWWLHLKSGRVTLARKRVRLVGVLRAIAKSVLLAAATACGATGTTAAATFDPDAGPFCALDSGLVAPLSAPDPCVVQCIAPFTFCQGPLPGSADWGCCVNPPLPDGAPNPANSCSTALCGRQ